MKQHIGIAAILSIFALLTIQPLCLSAEPPKLPVKPPCTIIAVEAVGEPLTAIAREYQRRTGNPLSLKLVSFEMIEAICTDSSVKYDVMFCMPKEKNDETPVSSMIGAVKVAWKHPGGNPVWGAALSTHPDAVAFLKFAGGPTGHRLWSESKAGFTMTSGRSHAEAFNWVVENRVKNTYALTAMRMLSELGGIRKGVCVDIGCGTGNMDVEIAKRSEFSIVGLDLDAEMEPLFYQRAKEAGLEDRMKFVAGDAQKMPFPDNFADVVVSRGTLTFIPDIGKCLQEVDRIMKPTGIAFLGGRYIYTPNEDKISTEKLRKIVSECGVPGARVVDQRGQWVKIIGQKAPESAQRTGTGPHMLPVRILADYNIVSGKCLLVFGKDGDSAASLQKGFVDLTELDITALYSSTQEKHKAEERIKAAGLDPRVTCSAGTIGTLPFEDESYDLVVCIGPALIFEKDRVNAMKQIYRVLRNGGASLAGGKFTGMPQKRKVSSEQLREDASKTGISSISVSDDMGQWVEIRKGIAERHFRD